MKNAVQLLLGITLAALVWPSCRPPESQGNGGQDSIPVRGDWVRLAIPNEPDNLHPYASVHAMATYIRDQLFQFLTDINPHTLDLEPVLVEALPTISEDNLRYTYRMRDEATWDDGKPITGHDYAFSVKAMLNPLTEAQHMRGYYSFIRDVQVDPNDPKRFTIVTDKIFFLSTYALGGFEVIPKHFYDPEGYLDKFSIADIQDDPDGKVSADSGVIKFATRFNSEPYKREPDKIVGSGPYRLESWAPGDRIVIARKATWWPDKIPAGPNRPFSFEAYPDKLVFKPIKDRAVAVQAIASGEVDLIWDVLPDEFDRIKADTADPIAKNCNLHTSDSYSWIYMCMNMRPPKNRKPLLAEQPVRRALAHLADVDRIIKTVYNGYGTRIIGPISPHNKNEYHTGLKPIPFDIERAKALLDSAGWKDSNGNGIRDKVVNGRSTELEIELLVSSSSTTAPQLGAILSEDAIKAGVKVNVVREDFKKIGQRLASHDFDMCGLGFNGSPIPADMKQVWHTESWTAGGTNYTGFGDTLTDKVIEQIRVTLDVEQRRKLYWQMQEELHEQQPMIFLMSPKERIIIHKRFKNQFSTVVRPGFKTRALWTPKEDQKFGDKPATETQGDGAEKPSH